MNTYYYLLKIALLVLAFHLETALAQQMDIPGRPRPGGLGGVQCECTAWRINPDGSISDDVLFEYILEDVDNLYDCVDITISTNGEIECIWIVNIFGIPGYMSEG